ncbi:low molecular weight phosphotyrosine protein phosphatase [Streptomyces sp. NPDC048442]|uniref:arsenate reductase/protein-tyrosine-phosphatase family protein n=1 Tax=Streptomyces sp. NPDC048442 TaxID=3154823 RepID=UPI003441B933
MWLGNYCRSPLAQAALAHRGRGAVAVRTAGLISKWQDRPAHPSMTNAARRLGHDLTPHRAQQINLEMLEWADDILAMGAAVLSTLEAVSGERNAHKRSRYLGDRDVPDPMGQSDDTFHECAVLVEAGTLLHLGRRP